MANKKITELTLIDAVIATDVLPIVDDPPGTPVTKKCTVTQLLASTEKTANKNANNGYAGLDANARLPFSRLVQATAASKLIGRQSGSAGDFQEITLGTGLTMSGTTLNASGGNITSTGAENSEPGSPFDGDLYFPNNSPYIKRRNTGASRWEPWGPAWPMIEPIDGDFAWINQGGATVSDTNGGVLLTGPATAGDSIRIRKKSAPSAPWTLTTYIMPLTGDQGASGSTYGIGFRQSSDGKLHLWMMDQNPSGSVYSIKFTNETTFSATYTSATYASLNVQAQNFPFRWLRIQDNNTDRKVYWSADGFVWVEFHSIGRTDFLTADEILFFVNSADASIATSIRLLSWLQA